MTLEELVSVIEKWSREDQRKVLQFFKDEGVVVNEINDGEFKVNLDCLTEQTKNKLFAFVVANTL